MEVANRIGSCPSKPICDRTQLIFSDPRSCPSNVIEPAPVTITGHKLTNKLREAHTLRVFAIREVPVCVTSRWVIEPLNKHKHSGLVPTTDAHECHHLGRRYGQVQVVQDHCIRPRWVCEFHVLELDTAPHRRQRPPGTAVRVDFGHAVNDLEHTPSRYGSLGELRVVRQRQRQTPA
jgi:hypothetical protein